MSNTAARAVSMEAWKPLPDWEELYEVSNLGRVRSIPRKGTGARWYRTYGGGIVKPLTASTGYLAVNLTAHGRRKQVLVHSVVLRAFAGERPNGYQACHNNGNRADARLENLRWDTCKNNHADAFRHGTRLVGSRSPRAKLDECLVAMLRRGEIAVDYVVQNYGLSRKHVSNVMAGHGCIADNKR